MQAQDTKTVLVTGATAGIGQQVAHGLARQGWRVLVHGRTAERARGAIEAMGPVGRSCVPVVGDVSSLGAVDDLVAQVQSCAPRGLDALVNNAGAAFTTRELTTDGVERTIAVNHVAAAALSAGLESALRDSAGRARVVQVTSYLEARARPVADWAYPRGWGQVRAYAYSKLANLAYSFHLARRWDGDIDVYLVDPGSVRTDFQRRAGGPLRVVGAVGGMFMSSATTAAAGVIDAVTDESVGPSGSYLRRGRVRTSSARSRDGEFQDWVAGRTREILGARHRG